MEDRINLKVSNYSELKQSGKVSIKTDVSGEIVILIKRYSPETGEEVKSFKKIISKEELLKQKQGLEQLLDGVNQMIADVDKELTSKESPEKKIA